MNNILFFLTPKAMCAYLYDDYTLRQALEKMESAGFAALPILNRQGEYRGTLTEGDLLWKKHLLRSQLRQVLKRKKRLPKLCWKHLPKRWKKHPLNL